MRDPSNQKFTKVPSLVLVLIVYSGAGSFWSKKNMIIITKIALRGRG
jgi:hypothetical protein